jgi:O-antigen ligase
MNEPLITCAVYQAKRDYFSYASAAMAASAVIIPSGYSIGAVLLLVGSIVVIFRCGLSHMDRLAWATVLAMSAYSVYWISSAAIRGADTAAFDQPSRLLLAAPVLIATAGLHLRWYIIWAGVALGGIATGIVGIYEAYVRIVPRAEGYIGPEHFGNLSILFGTLSFIGFAWATSTDRTMGYRALLLLGFVGGIAGSFTSGTRASWVSLLVISLILLALFWWLRWRVFSIIIMLIIVSGGVGIALSDNSRVVERIEASISDMAYAVNEDTGHGSMSRRFEAWEGAWMLFLDKPLFGWGQEEYQNQMRNLAADGYITDAAARFNHAHNDWMNTGAKRGVIGLVILGAVYLLPLINFAVILRSGSNEQEKIVALGGTVVVINFIVYGLVHHALGSNNGIMNFAFWTAVFVGSCTGSRTGIQRLKTTDVTGGARVRETTL